MRIERKLLLACLFAVAVSTPGHAKEESKERASVDAAHGQRLAEHLRLERPAGPGPFPAVILIPGCSGFDSSLAKPHYDGAQARLVALGFLTVRVNYLAAREARSCISVPTALVAGDIAWVAAELRRNPLVKPGALNLLGWSWGGASALRALSADGDRRPVPVDAVVAFYPACQYAAPWDAAVPVLVLHGDIDDVAPLAACEKLFAALPPASRPRLRVLAGAHHAFDNAQLPPTFNYAYGTLGSNPQAAAAAWSELTAFLKR